MNRDAYWSAGFVTEEESIQEETDQDRTNRPSSYPTRRELANAVAKLHAKRCKEKWANVKETFVHVQSVGSKLAVKTKASFSQAVPTIMGMLEKPLDSYLWFAEVTDEKSTTCVDESKAERMSCKTKIKGLK